MTRREIAYQLIKNSQLVPLPTTQQVIDRVEHFLAAIEAALKARDERAAKICNDYEHRCAETCAQTQNASEGTSESRTYWRADGASDALEIVAEAIMADDADEST